jgi:uracil-DNA glycosylase family 4
MTREKPAASGKSTRRGVVQKLESLERAGVTHLPKGRAPAKAALPSEAEDSAPAKIQPEVPKQDSAHAPAKAKPAALAPSDRLAALQVIQREVAACTRCGELASTRTQTVFGVGNPQARLCFVGEAPGADEDRQGEPFVGRAGQLLTKIIEACTLRREDVYILNVLKCRPPGNRTPLPPEVANCRGYLDRQLEIIRPAYICCLGLVASTTLLGVESSMAKLRGKFHEYRGIPVICTYHPAYLLRNPPAKREVWEDMKTLLRQMGIEFDAQK